MFLFLAAHRILWVHKDHSWVLVPHPLWNNLRFTDYIGSCCMHTLAMTIKTPCLIAESNYLYEKSIKQGTELITVLKPPCVCPYMHACLCVHVYGCVILSLGGLTWKDLSCCLSIIPDFWLLLISITVSLTMLFRYSHGDMTASDCLSHSTWFPDTHPGTIFLFTTEWYSMAWMCHSWLNHCKIE